MDGLDLKRERERLGMTQLELSKQFGRDIRTIENWEAKNSKLPLFVDKVIEQVKNERR